MPYASDAPLGDDPIGRRARRARQRPGRRLGHRVRRRRDRRPQQLIERIEAVLRRLHADVVADAVGRVQPEARRHLVVAAQRNQHAARHVALRQAHLARPSRGRRSGSAAAARSTWWMCTSAAPGIAATCCREPLRDLVVGRGIAADHLQVDRRGQAEVQDLVRDVRRLEEEHHVRELLVQPLAQPDFVLAHRPVALAIERNQNLAVGRRDVRHVALREAAPGVRDPDVVEDGVDLAGRQRVANLLLDVGEPELGLLDARSRRRARVQPHLPGVHVGEEVAADHRDQQQRSERHRQNPISTGARLAERQVQQAHVAIAQPLEQPVHAAMEAPEKPRAAVPAGVVQPRPRCAAGSAPSSAPAFATAGTTPSSRTPPPSPAA